MSKRWMRHLLPFAVLAVCTITGLTAVRRFEAWAAEDGWIEWGTFLSFILAGTLATGALFGKPKADALTRLAFLGIAVFCFFVAGEEISWGQRLISFKPPDIFLEKNFQQESNLHNLLKDILDTRWMVFGICVLYGAILPRFKRLKPLAATPQLMPWLLAVALLELTYPFKLAGELAELILGQTFLLDVLDRREASNARASIFQVAALAGPLLLIPAIDAVIYRNAAADSPIAKTELELLRNDLTKPGVLREKLYRKSSVHKRIFTAMRSRYLQLDAESTFLEGQPARRDRRGYFLDPWNQPYWFSFHRKKKTGERLLLYSFGPDRRRDVDPPRWNKETPVGDDIVVEVPLAETSTTTF